MKEYAVENMRNVAVVSHGGAGKTTLVEAMLYLAKATDRFGKVDDGNTVTDFEPEEIARKSSISSAAAFFEWNNRKVTVVDTPGYINFIEDAKGCMRAVEAAVVIISPISGIKAETERVWEYANEFGLPRIIYVSKLDKERSDFKMVMAQLHKGFCKEATNIHLPIGDEADFRGIVDLLKMKALIFDPNNIGKYKEEEIPIDLANEAEECRGRMVEKVAESDDVLIEKYLETGELSDDEIIQGLRAGCISGKIVPVLCGATTKGIGVTQLMDMINLTFPNPAEKAAADPPKGVDPNTGKEVVRRLDASEPFSAIVFKTIADPFAGKLSLFRVMSGQVKSDSNVYNANHDKEERIGQVFYLMGKKQVAAQVLKAGEIGAVAKLKDTVTGDTLCDKAAPIKYEPIKYMEPVMSFAIEPRNKGDEDKISLGLTRLLEEDPTLRFTRNVQTHEMILSGMGQTHLEVTAERLKRKFGTEIVMKTPRIPYKETIKGTTKVQGKHKKQSGGRGQYGDTWIEIEPIQGGDGFEFVDKIVGGAIPRQYIPAVEKGIHEAMHEGVIAGYPVVGVRVTLYDGSYHDVDSSEMAFKIAGSVGFKKGVLECKPTLLEPIMNVTVVMPEDTMGNVIGDLNSRRGKVQGMTASGMNQKVTASVPLAEMLSYAPTLNSLTSGRGLYTMEFDHYEEVPAHLAQKIIEEGKSRMAERHE
ncbi:MAG: elongation factor G [Nitrospirae bacterium]|nr:elongation factor G [Nitrospirota bacterium]